MAKAPDDNDLKRAQGGAYDPESPTVPYVPEKTPTGAPKKKPGKRSADGHRPDSRAKTLIGLAESHGVDLFHCGGTACAAVDIGARRATLRIHSQEFAALLLRWLYEARQATASPQIVSQVQATLAARATHEGKAQPVFVRVGKAGDALYLDLGDSSGRAVETTAAGWRIVERPPVHFLRPAGMLPLPAARA